MWKAIERMMGKNRIQGQAKSGPAYRHYVGSYWDHMGRLQTGYLMQQGLQPHHYLLDLGCGSLRAGRFLILYLNPGHYYGLDKHQWLIDEGTTNELSSVVVEQKKPVFVVTDRFDVGDVTVKFDYVWAQSVFTHLTLADIELCLTQMKHVAGPQTRFLATFNENKKKESENPSGSDPKLDFWFGFDTIERVGNSAGYNVKYRGKFSIPGLEHPYTDDPTTPTRMVEFTLR